MDARLPKPSVAETSWVAPGATVVGDARLGPETSVWYGAVLRADTATITLGARSNVQDGCILHVNEGEPCTIGEDCTLGHGAIVHAATVEDGCLIGIRATILSGAVIGKGSLVGAGALVAENKVIPPGSLVLGMPGRVVRSLTPEEQARILESAGKYVGYAALHRANQGIG